MPSALATLDVESALAEIRNGTIARQIAERYGTTAQAVRSALKRARPEEYKLAVAEQVEHWVDESTQEMNDLPEDAVCIARARARADYRLRLAGVLNPAFSAKQQIEHTGSITVEHSLKFDAGSLLDSVRTVASMPKATTYEADDATVNQLMDKIDVTD